MSYERIARDFHQRIDTIAAAVDDLAPQMERAAGMLLDAALNDHRVFLCAGDADAGIADYLARYLRDGDGAAPALPVLSIVGAPGDGDDAPLWRDLRALTRDGDVILCLDSSDGGVLAQRAATLAAERNLPAVLLSELPGDAAANALHLPLEAAAPALRRELAIMVLHSLHALIMHNLMGGEEP